MDTFEVGSLGHHSFDNSMGAGDIGMALPWYGDMALPNPKYHGVQKAMTSLIPCIRYREIECDASGLLSQRYGLENALSTQPLSPQHVSAASTTSWTTSSTLSIKAEDDSGSKKLQASPTASSHADDIVDDEASGIGVDVLMKAIQTKCQAPQRQLPSPPSTASSRRESNSSLNSSALEPCNAQRPRGKGQYQCPVISCSKIFTQKGRLSVHSRAHTGYKPYRCKATGCGQYFSQMGNLKTHERRHTGERPFQCNLCDRSFAQSGNMRAHRVVHQHVKPYQCKLEDCSKRFTQLGNLKSHQNKFHAEVLQNLTTRFASLQEGDIVSAADKELWEYFSSLYKHSNKGIKGRGKDRRISIVSVEEIDVKAGEESVSGASAELRIQ